MTHEELIEKVARDICQSDMIDDIFDEMSSSQKVQYLFSAKAAISTILSALQEPTEEMMKTVGATSIQRLVWQAMLSASPLAPKEK